MASQTITIRTTKEITSAINKLAESMDRSRNWIVETAIKDYIELQAWQVAGIEKALLEVDQGKVQPHDKVFSNLKKKLAKLNK